MRLLLCAQLESLRIFALCSTRLMLDDQPNNQFGAKKKQVCLLEDRFPEFVSKFTKHFGEFSLFLLASISHFLGRKARRLVRVNKPRCGVFPVSALLGLCISLLGLFWQVSSLHAQRVRNLPEEPIEFAAHYPSRPNALDLMPSANGWAMLRYQRATATKLSFLFELTGYTSFLNVFQLLTTNSFSLGSITTDFRGGFGVGLALWPWDRLRKGYIALRSQIIFQVFRSNHSGNTFDYNRFLVGNAVELGVRLGKQVFSAGVFGGVGVLVPTNTSEIVSINISQPYMYAYLGASIGLTFR